MEKVPLNKNRTPNQSVTLRDYTKAEIAEFIEKDKLDDETREIIKRFLVKD